MMSKKVFYRGCNERGKELLEGGLVTIRGPAKLSKWIMGLDNLECEICGSDIDKHGAYLLNISSGKSIKEKEYYCFDCCHDENMFGEFRENYDMISENEIGKIL